MNIDNAKEEARKRNRTIAATAREYAVALVRYAEYSESLADGTDEENAATLLEGDAILDALDEAEARFEQAPEDACTEVAAAMAGKVKTR